MPRTEILAGRNLLTERPIPDKRFTELRYLSGDLYPKPVLVGLTYDTRHLSPQGNPYLVLADDANRKILFCDSVTMTVHEAFDYPYTVNSSLTALESGPCVRCYGIATMNEPSDCIFGFLSEEQGLDAKSKDTVRYPILYYLRYNPDPNLSSSNEKLVIEEWHVVDMGKKNQAFTYKKFGRGLSEYHNDFLVIGAWGKIAEYDSNGDPKKDSDGDVMYTAVDSIINLDKYGEPLAYYPAFTVADEICGVQHINGRIYTTMDKTSDPDIGGRILAKFITEQIDNTRMIPLMSIEPFFLGPAVLSVPKKDNPTQTEDAYFGPEITIFQDRMAACYADNVYTYRMCYFMFIVDGLPNDDIDMGSILIGDYKIKKVTLKNIADVYKLKDVVLTVDQASIPTTAPKQREAASWVKMSAVDPSTAEASSGVNDPKSGGFWQSSIALATSEPYIEPDGEVQFYVRVDVPESYSTVTDISGSAVAVSVDDGPFVAPVVIRARVG